MFNKPKQTGTEDSSLKPAETETAVEPAAAPAAPAPSAPATPSSPSIISAALHITGNLNSAADVEIRGKIDGDVKARSVKLDKSGTVNGKIMAESVHVSGSIKGQILAQAVALSSSAKVDGDILHETLAVEAGAHMNGHCRRIRESDRNAGATTGANGAAKSKGGNAQQAAQRA